MEHVINNLARIDFESGFCNAKYIIVGTMPGEKSRTDCFYYLDHRNSFWKIMSNVLDVDFLSMIQKAEYKKAYQVLLDNGIVLSDVLSECDIDGAKDNTITNPIRNEKLCKVIERNKNAKLCFNGKKAYKLFCSLFKEYAERLREEAIILTSSSNANPCKDKDIIWKEKMA